MTSASTAAPSPAVFPAVAPAVVLTIAGSESTGGAGAQADLRTFQGLGVFGIANLTCIVSFDLNDSWNHRFMPVDQQVIADQLEATTAAYGAVAGAPSVAGRPVLDTVKIGMLGSPATIGTVAAALEAGALPECVVLDPVLICKGQEPGHALDTDQALKAQILPLATFVTPNHFEAESLSGLAITDVESLKSAAIRIHELSGAAVSPKAGCGWLAGRRRRLLRRRDPRGPQRPQGGRGGRFGAGCSLAAAVTANSPRELLPWRRPGRPRNSSRRASATGWPRVPRSTRSGRAARANPAPPTHPHPRTLSHLMWVFPNGLSFL